MSDSIELYPILSVRENKEEQIIETRDKPQCLVAAKATLTLTIPGCNKVVYNGFIAYAI